MQLPSLVTSVPDLQIARILAAAGAQYIAFDQSMDQLSEISQWLEGPQTGVEIDDPNHPVPQVDFLIVPIILFEQFAFFEKKIFWKSKLTDIDEPAGMIFIREAGYSGPENGTGACFYHYSDRPDNRNKLTWIDYKKDQLLFEKIFITA